MANIVPESDLETMATEYPDLNVATTMRMYSADSHVNVLEHSLSSNKLIENNRADHRTCARHFFLTRDQFTLLFPCPFDRVWHHVLADETPAGLARRLQPFRLEKKSALLLPNTIPLNPNY